MTTTRVADDQKHFAEGFLAGWYSIFGLSVIPTIIPDCPVPAGKSPFEYGYEQARSFAGKGALTSLSMPISSPAAD
jgi:hypothetical protein